MFEQITEISIQGGYIDYLYRLNRFLHALRLVEMTKRTSLVEMAETKEQQI